jgi:hypothetical protein
MSDLSSNGRDAFARSRRRLVVGLFLVGAGALATVLLPWSRPTARGVDALAPPNSGALGSQERPAASPELDAPPLEALGPSRPAGTGVRCRIVCDESPAWTVEAVASAQVAPVPSVEPPRAPAGERALAFTLPPGDWALRASAPDFVGPWRTVVVPATARDQEIELDLPLQRCSRVIGSVQRPDGGALDGFPVTVRDAAGRALARARTDALGVFRLDCVPPAVVRLVVGAPARPDAEPLDVEVLAGVTDVGTIPLRPLRDLRVLVVDASDVPVPDALVRASADLDDPDDEPVRTDATGRAVVRRLPMGELRLHASHADGARGNTPVGANEPAEEVVIVLRRPGEAAPANGR